MAKQDTFEESDVPSVDLVPWAERSSSDAMLERLLVGPVFNIQHSKHTFYVKTPNYSEGELHKEPFSTLFFSMVWSPEGVFLL